MSALMAHARTSQLVAAHFLLNDNKVSGSTGARFSAAPACVEDFLIKIPDDTRRPSLAGLSPCLLDLHYAARLTPAFSFRRSKEM